MGPLARSLLLSTRQANFVSLSWASGEGGRLANVLLFQIGKSKEQLLDRPAGSKRFHDHANCHTHTPNTKRKDLSPTSMLREIEVELRAEFAAGQC